MQVADKTDLSELVDFDAVLPCSGVLYEEADGSDSLEPCDRPAKWTRSAHCGHELGYCQECKDTVSEWSRHGWVQCAECRVIIWPESLNWFLL